MKTSSTPVSVKSSKVVRKVALATGSSPRAANTAKAVPKIVPPTQNPKALICLAPVISCVTWMALMAAFSMYSSHVLPPMLASGLRQLTTKVRWP